MHYMDASKTYGEKARWKLHKNAASNIEQVLESPPTKQQLYGHLLPITMLHIDLRPGQAVKRRNAPV